jgi:peroxiredoxin
MRKNHKILIPAIFIVLIVFMVYKITAYKIEQEKLTEKIQILPSFSFSKLNSQEKFTNKAIEPNKPLIITYFHPDCNFCQEQATQINKQIESFNKYQILFISNAEAYEIDSFAIFSMLSDKENIIFLHDKDLIFEKIFGKTVLPTSFIYNKQHVLVKQFKGEARIEELLK